MPQRPGRVALFAILFAASGAAGLVYQVVWMRQLGLLFGNTAEAAAATLSAFFLGLAWGGRVAGRRTARMRRPLVVFGFLELGVAVSALGVFLILPLYDAIFPALYRSSFDLPLVFLLIKLLLALVCLLPAAFLMGATLPVLGEALAGNRQTRGRTVALLYGINTVGAALGAFAAAFLLPRAFGYETTCLLAVATSASVGLLSLQLARSREARDPAADVAAPTKPVRGQLLWLAAASGFGVLALEVLWTHLFARTLQNSVYTFGAILVVVLTGLAGGAFVARLLMRRYGRRRTMIAWLFAVSAVTVAFTPLWAEIVRGGAWFTAGSESFAGYVFAVFSEVALIVLPATITIGTVFPYLIHAAGRTRAGTGEVVGALVFANLLGAVFGALDAGFFALPLMGPRIAASAVAVVYLACALWVMPWRLKAARPVAAGLCVAVAVGLIVTFLVSRAGLVPSRERLVDTYHGSAGTVTISKTPAGSIKLRLNRSYALGGSADPRWERLQAHIPLMIHPEPKNVFFIGLGTGITASGALDHDVDRVVVAELIPEVVDAARDHFATHARGLFEDKRVTIRVDDARSILRGTEERYDVIVGDLFLPWKRGVGNVYTKEQLEAGRARLAPGGLYAQWLPLYQLGEAELKTIAKTFRAVFPRVTVWRGDFFAKRPIVALVGHESDAPLDAAAFEERFADAGQRGLLGSEQGARALGFHLYAGSLASAAARVDDAPLTTDDRPWVELLAPQAERERKYGDARAFTSARLLSLYEEMHEAVRPKDDPFLADASLRQISWVEGGYWLYAIAVWEKLRNPERRREAWREWVLHVSAKHRPKHSAWI